MRDDYEVSFGTWLLGRIRTLGMTQRQVAKGIGASPGMVTEWIKDRRKPNPTNCARLAAYLGVPEEDVLVRAGYRVRKDTDPDPLRAELMEAARQLPLSEAATVLDFIRWRQAESLRPRPRIVRDRESG